MLKWQDLRWAPCGRNMENGGGTNVLCFPLGVGVAEIPFVCVFKTEKMGSFLLIKCALKT